MPYIKQEDRDSVFDREPHELTVGELNYVITKVIDGYLSGDDRLSYEKINGAIGVLECAKLEAYRRIAVPYETQKCHDNGDVYTCTESS